MKNYTKNEDGVSPVIAVILMVAITVVLAAVLYIMVSGMMTITSTTPTGALEFDRSESIDGLYIGTFVTLSRSVRLSDASFTIIDDDIGQSASQDPINEGISLEISGGMNCTYFDSDDNSKIDGGDTIKVYNAESGDIIKFIYNPTGGIMAQYVFV